jgi:hypothetical protein
MKTKVKAVTIHSTPEEVFAYMDNLGNTGMHMMESSMMMMGSKLHLEQISKNATGLGATFRWYGKVMGFKMDFTVVVTTWIENVEKVWETVGDAKMIILGWYQMRLILAPAADGTNAELSIEYTKPSQLLYRIISFFLSGWYANWCLSNMLNDTKKHFETHE